MSDPLNHLGSIWFGLFLQNKEGQFRLSCTKNGDFFTAGPSYFVRALLFTMSGYIVKMIIIFTRCICDFMPNSHKKLECYLNSNFNV